MLLKNVKQISLLVPIPVPYLLYDVNNKNIILMLFVKNHYYTVPAQPYKSEFERKKKSRKALRSAHLKKPVILQQQQIKNTGILSIRF